MAAMREGCELEEVGSPESPAARRVMRAWSEWTAASQRSRTSGSGSSRERRGPVKSWKAGTKRCRGIASNAARQAGSGKTPARSSAVTKSCRIRSARRSSSSATSPTLTLAGGGR
jgi:hypothetical protein